MVKVKLIREPNSFFSFLEARGTFPAPGSQLLWSQLQAAAHWRIQRADAISHGIWGTFTPMKYSNKGPKVVILSFSLLRSEMQSSAVLLVLTH